MTTRELRFADGQEMTVLIGPRASGGELLQLEYLLPAKTLPLPLHAHPRSEQTVHIKSGAMHWHVGGAIGVAHAGQSVTVPPNTPHTFWNPHEEEVRALDEMRPATELLEFFEILIGLAAAGKVAGSGFPPLLHAAVILSEFRDSWRPAWPAARALAPLIPVLAAVGRVVGYRGRYPEYVSGL